MLQPSMAASDICTKPSNLVKTPIKKKKKKKQQSSEVPISHLALSSNIKDTTEI